MEATSTPQVANGATSVSDSLKVRFGIFDVDPATGELRKAGVRLKVQEQPFQVLAALLERPGQLVTRDELRARLWPSGEFLDYDHALTTAVKKLRRALNDSAVHPRFIETLPKRGYRFIAPVEPVSEATLTLSAQPEPIRSQRIDSLRRQRAALAVAVLAAAAALVWIWPRPERTDSPPVRRFTVAGEGELFAAQISPDGRLVAALGSPGPSIHIHNLEQGVSRRLEGTEDTNSFFAWSPDSESLLFRSGAQLKRISVRGGPAATVCDLPGGSFVGAAWHPESDAIIFSAGLPPTLHSVPAAGGTPEPYLRPEVLPAGGANVHPAFITAPDGSVTGLAFGVGGPSDQQLFVVDLASDERRHLGPGTQPVWDPAGYLLHRSDVAAAGIWSRPFSAEMLQPTGPAVLVDPEGGAPSIASDGTLLYTDAQGLSAGDRLVWRDRSGQVLGEIGRPQNRIRAPALSPDERYVAVEGTEDDNNDIWIYDVAGGVRTRLTHDPSIETGPVWRPDASAVAYRFDREGNAEIFERARDRMTESQPLLATTRGELPNSFSPDGATLVYSVSDPTTRYDLWVVEGSPENTRPLLVTPFNEVSAQLSPDGNWLAYCSDESGRYEVYVRSFPDGQTLRQVSDGGACQPRWSRNGRELFFVENNALIAVEAVFDDGVFEPGSRAALFRDPSLRAFPTRRSYDVTGDGRRFVVVDSVEQPTERIRQTRVVQNWRSLVSGSG